MLLLDRVKDAALREWYLRAAVEYGWSRNLMVLQIKSGLHEREGKALTNSSIQTTERYLGSDQEIAVAVNDNLGL
jgi:predicted nuclease of restriction endonuclease-like (RecB) superfamily